MSVPTATLTFDCFPPAIIRGLNMYHPESVKVRASQGRPSSPPNIGRNWRRFIPCRWFFHRAPDTRSLLKLTHYWIWWRSSPRPLPGVSCLLSTRLVYFLVNSNSIVCKWHLHLYVCVIFHCNGAMDQGCIHSLNSVLHFCQMTETGCLIANLSALGLKEDTAWALLWWCCLVFPAVFISCAHGIMAFD